ncbi:hypothetical protein LCGC14_2342340 [marine sediment metagenome]|uniref:Uncharacterized protein n=1 Tax=marine sediment metagenome TaxID=412755 RepID=A0A0F9CCI8_9ZZZZ
MKTTARQLSAKIHEVLSSYIDVEFIGSLKIMDILTIIFSSCFIIRMMLLLT